MAVFPQGNTATKKESVRVYIRENGIEQTSTELLDIKERAVHVSYG